MNARRAPCVWNRDSRIPGTQPHEYKYRITPDEPCIIQKNVHIHGYHIHKTGEIWIEYRIWFFATLIPPSWPRLASSWIKRSGPAGARQTLAHPGPRQTSILPLMLTSARPPTRAWEVARTVVAPPLSVVKCLWEVFVWGSCRARVCAGVGGVFSVGVSCVRVTCWLFYM